jgi:PAS domain S-box-containing protein
MVAALLVVIVVMLFPSTTRARQALTPKRILLLYWNSREYAGNVAFDQTFRKGLQSVPPGSIEYYSEYLESNRFPGEKQSRLFRDYLRTKYADRRIDVILAVTDQPLAFLLKYRRELFTNIPIVFVAVQSPTATELAAGPGMTGIVYGGDQSNTIDLALKIHPATEQLFVVSGTLDHDQRFEMASLKNLAQYKGRLSITYLTDLPLGELIAKTSRLPERSILLYLWQQSADEKGNVLGAPDVLTLIAHSAPVPVYGLADPVLGSGIVGGYLRSPDRMAARATEMALRIANGTRAGDIPVESPVLAPLFDSRQLKRWGISENQLPPGSIVHFKEATLWEQHTWSIVGAIAFCFGQTLLIVGLVLQRSRRKRVEKALAERELHFRESQAIAHIGSYHWDAVANTVTWSDEMCRIHGYEPGQLIMTLETYLDRVHPDDREQVRLSVERPLTDPRPFDHEYRIVPAVGQIRWVFAKVRPVVDSKGNLLALQGTCQDMTERKRTSDSLRDSETRNRAMLEAVPDMMFFFSRDGVYLDFHVQDPSVLLVPPEQFIGKKIRDVMPGNLADQFEKCFEDVIQSGQTGLVEYSLPFLGEERYYEARVVNCDGNRVLSLVRDITEHKHIEQALRASEGQARRTLVEQMLVGVAECDEDGKFVLVNQRFCDITGFTEAELLGMRRRDITHPEDLLRAEKRYRRKDGSEVWVNSSISHIMDLRNQVAKSVTVVIDVTDRKRAEREREQLLKQEKTARAAAEAANRSKDEFLAVVSHEMRNPVFAILGYTRLLRGTMDVLEVQQTADILEQNGRIQLQLIEDLLDNARIITGKLKLEIKPVLLSHVITAALDVVRPAAQAKGILLLSDLEPFAGRITGDPDRLQQIVWNLLSNAIKFTPQAGRVELRMEKIGDQVLITVKDTGKGIEPEFLPFCFDRFRQSDSSSAQRFGGLGLGLSLVKQLVELHGGTIEAASEGLGRGATFTVTLPQHPNQDV